jgi:seryl-tRNA synthetase
MLSRQFVRENPETVREALANKGVDVDLEQILDVDAEWRELKQRGDDLRHERNEVSSTIGELKQAGEEAAAQEAIERSSELKSELQAIEARAEELESTLESALLRLPQIPDDSVPVGADESENREVRREGFADRRELPASVVPHYDLGDSRRSRSTRRRCVAPASSPSSPRTPTASAVTTRRRTTTTTSGCCRPPRFPSRTSTATRSSSARTSR